MGLHTTVLRYLGIKYVQWHYYLVVITTLIQARTSLLVKVVSFQKRESQQFGTYLLHVPLESWYPLTTHWHYQHQQSRLSNILLDSILTLVPRAWPLLLHQKENKTSDHLNRFTNHVFGSRARLEAGRLMQHSASALASPAHRPPQSQPGTQNPSDSVHSSLPTMNPPSESGSQVRSSSGSGRSQRSANVRTTP